MPELKENTVQQTLCMPLWGRAVAAKKYPSLFPDHDAGRIVKEMGVDWSGKKLYRFQYMWMCCLIRQYNMAWEIRHYLKKHPRATVVELGAGLSCLRRQMGNETNSWYCLDMENVIPLREKHIPLGKLERNVVCDLNDFSWFDQIDFRPEDGIVFTAGGLFYYFEKEQVHRLLCAMAERFPGGMVTSFFSLEKPKEELEGWSDCIVNVAERDYIDGYLKGGWRKSIVTRVFAWVMRTFHMSFMIHGEFRKR